MVLIFLVGIMVVYGMVVFVIALPMPCAKNWAFLLFQLLMVGIVDK